MKGGWFRSAPAASGSNTSALGRRSFPPAHLVLHQSVRVAPGNNTSPSPHIRFIYRSTGDNTQRGAFRWAVLLFITGFVIKPKRFWGFSDPFHLIRSMLTMIYKEMLQAAPQQQFSAFHCANEALF